MFDANEQKLIDYWEKSDRVLDNFQTYETNLFKYKTTIYSFQVFGNDIVIKLTDVCYSDIGETCFPFQLDSADTGYHIQFTVNGSCTVNSNVLEWLMFNVITEFLTDTLGKLDWVFVVFHTVRETDYRLQNAIAQHLTIKLSGIERYAYTSNIFIVSRE